MEMLERRILEEGRVLDGGILMVDSFLNYQVDMPLMQEIGKAFVEHFRPFQIELGYLAEILHVFVIGSRKSAFNIIDSHRIQSPG